MCEQRPSDVLQVCVTGQFVTVYGNLKRVLILQTLYRWWSDQYITVYCVDNIDKTMMHSITEAAAKNNIIIIHNIFVINYIPPNESLTVVVVGLVEICSL